MSLRARLLVGMVVLVAAGLAAAGIVTYEEQRSFLLDRVDQQVESALVPLAFQLRVGTAGDRRPADRPAAARAALRPARGGRRAGGGAAAWHLRRAPQGRRHGAATAHLHLRRARRTGRRRSPPVRRSAAAERPPAPVHGRAPPARSPLPRRPPSPSARTPRVVAVPLRESEQTLHRLVMVEALVAGGVILALVALGWFVIRLGLRPLERIGRVASEIAGGDLSRRVASTASAHRGRAPGPLAQRDARPDRAGLHRPPAQRGPPAALPGRRLP